MGSNMETSVPVAKNDNGNPHALAFHKCRKLNYFSNEATLVSMGTRMETSWGTSTGTSITIGKE
jgi:hypothetical protein